MVSPGVGRFLSNHYLREEVAVHTHVVEQRVEWYGAWIYCHEQVKVSVHWLDFVCQNISSEGVIAFQYCSLLFKNNWRASILAFMLEGYEPAHD